MAIGVGFYKLVAQQARDLMLAMAAVVPVEAEGSATMPLKPELVDSLERVLSYA
jgi:hypothetical protein